MAAVAAVGIGVANGWLGAWVLGRVTIARLSDRMPDVFSRIRYGQIFRENDASILARIEDATLKGEQQLHETRRKEREARIAAQ